MGPLPLYPHLGNSIGRLFVRFSWSNEIDDPNEPARIVNRLESTAIGCAWLLGPLARAALAAGGRLDLAAAGPARAIRMLGRQPMDAVEDDRVMMIYLACWAMAPDGPHGFADLVNELHPAELKLFIDRLDDRQAKSRQPASPEAGQAELLAIIAEEEERLEVVLEQHLERDETVDPALLFDGSEEGERLRRYEATCDRGLIRVLAALRQRRRDGEAGATASGPRTRDNGRATSRPRQDDAGDRAALLARLLSSMAGNGTVTNEANGRASVAGGEPTPTSATRLRSPAGRDERSQRPVGSRASRTRTRSGTAPPPARTTRPAGRRRRRKP